MLMVMVTPHWAWYSQAEGIQGDLLHIPSLFSLTWNADTNTDAYLNQDENENIFLSIMCFRTRTRNKNIILELELKKATSCKNSQEGKISLSFSVFSEETKLYILWLFAELQVSSQALWLITKLRIQTERIWICCIKDTAGCGYFNIYSSSHS